MKKYLIILSGLFISPFTLADQNLDNIYYEAVQKLQDFPLSLNVAENDKKYIQIYTGVNNTMVSTNTKKNANVYSPFKTQIDAECNKLKISSTENVSSAYCKASLNIAIYSKL